MSEYQKYNGFPDNHSLWSAPAEKPTKVDLVVITAVVTFALTLLAANVNQENKCLPTNSTATPVEMPVRTRIQILP